MDQHLKRLTLALLAQQIPPGYQTDPLADDTKLLDCGLDSLNMMSFWVALERKGPPGIDIGKLDFDTLDTVADVVRHVERLCESLPAAS